MEIAHFYGLWNYLDSFSAKDPIKTFPEVGYVLLVAAHMIMLGYLMYLVARSIMDPRKDPIRAVGQDDPLAGEFAGVPDRFTLRGLLPGAKKDKELAGSHQ